MGGYCTLLRDGHSIVCPSLMRGQWNSKRSWRVRQAHRARCGPAQRLGAGLTPFASMGEQGGMFWESKLFKI